MKIDIDRSRVSLTPETAEEAAKLEAVWRLLVECIGDSRKLVPIGEYLPHKSADQCATFHIEGMDADDPAVVEVRVAVHSQVHCRICNKLLNLEAGDPIPFCCGKMMEVVD